MHSDVCESSFCTKYHFKRQFKTFTFAAVNLKEIQNQAEVTECLTKKRCQWRFIPSLAAWYGGFWERLIGITKMQLKKSLGRAYVTSG